MNDSGWSSMGLYEYDRNDDNDYDEGGDDDDEDDEGDDDNDDDNGVSMQR
jgi:hypothetical protein